MKFPRRSWRWLAVPGIVISADVAAYAQVYLTVERAQQLVFPGETFTPVPFALTAAQKRQIQERCGVAVRTKDPKVWRTASGGYFFVDEVLGKHEFITWAIGITSQGEVKQIEILDYRETYGYEVRDAQWRKQFVGKTAAAPLRLDDDIKNISGATLSCRHVTDGVKKVLAMYELFLKKGM